MAKYLSFWLFAFFVFILDRISKFLILRFVPLNSSIDFKLFSISHVRNTGTLFGLFQNASWFFILFSLAVIIYLLVKHSSFSSSYQPILGLILGGALGNLFDRIFYGSVIDFIDFHFWPSFNIADSAVCVAILLLLVYEYILNKRKI